MNLVESCMGQNSAESGARVASSGHYEFPEIQMHGDARAALTGPAGRMPPRSRRVLIVDDDEAMRRALQISFLRHGWQADLAPGLRDALTSFRWRVPDLVVSDVCMPSGDGLALLRQLRDIEPKVAVIFLTAFPNIETAVSAIRDGACDYLVKPVDYERLDETANRLVASNSAQSADLKTIGSAEMWPEMVGQSPAWLRALGQAQKAAGSSADILVQAESGTGKELLARMIHRLSSRSGKPFVALNCAAFPESLLESELFGHAKGAFTGAVAARPGKFEQAHGGTILLDEVGEMPLHLQPKLLRALQEREIDRLGDSRPVKVDIRVVATTNRSLITMVEDGRFRADLYYRLNVIALALPPLRERPEDIALLAAHFARLYSPPGGPISLSPGFLQSLTRHAWPGNVRELANRVRGAVALGESFAANQSSSLLDVEPRTIGKSSQRRYDSVSGTSPEMGDCALPGTSLGAMERQLLEATLKSVGGNRSRAAEMLGVSLRTVRNKIRGYGLPPRESYRQEGGKPCP